MYVRKFVHGAVSTWFLMYCLISNPEHVGQAYVFSSADV